MIPSTKHVLVSVIIPVKNGAAFIVDALNSIKIQNEFKENNIEVIVIDDASTDQTVDLVKSTMPQAHILSCNYARPSTVRNVGLKKAQGEFIAFLDHDDKWPLDKISKQLALFKDNPHADIVLGRTQYMAMPGYDLPPMQFPYADNSLYHVHLGSALVKKTVFDTIGDFDTHLQFSEDHDFFFRARESKLGIIKSPEIALIYRLHQHNMTKNLNIAQVQLSAVLRQSLKRRDQLETTQLKYFSFNI